MAPRRMSLSLPQLLFCIGPRARYDLVGVVKNMMKTRSTIIPEMAGFAGASTHDEIVGLLLTWLLKGLNLFVSRESRRGLFVQRVPGLKNQKPIPIIWLDCPFVLTRCINGYALDLNTLLPFSNASFSLGARGF